MASIFRLVMELFLNMFHAFLAFSARSMDASVILLFVVILRPSTFALDTILILLYGPGNCLL